ncbi:AMP-dependent synthetase [Arthrobacter livingstonensis]|uniref:AMP-dependent synthetase n=1 Tax=Arthrobacter livingstonensis TaxID=670078 RepID=A0A2V5L517_9MICC|nr:AMP-binding protein [Arthrobacter livingstonensis]PYI66248.1 AMP-dependent synthetase [Arthrobacter livingstonensis]
MPFIDQLQYWARAQPHRSAVVVGPDRLSFVELRDAATRAQALVQASGAPAFSVIDEPNGTGLAVKFCAAVAGHGVAAVVDAAWPAGLKAAVSAKAGAWAAAQACPAPASGFQDGPPGSTFLLGLSSGTSGVPKAFTRSRESWRASLAQSARYFGVTPSDVTLAPGPMASSMNLYALGEALSTGSTFVSLRQFSADAALHAIKHDAVTRLVLVPTVLAVVARRGLEAGQGAGAVTSIVCAGSALPAEVLDLARQWAPHATIFHYYGASELGFVAASEAGVGAGYPCVGPAFPGVEISVRGSDGEVAGTGVCGSIYVRGPYVSNGYAWGDDGLAFNPLPGSDPAGEAWYTVHDQGFTDASGRLHVVGRASDMIVTGGVNVYPQQVEAELATAAGPGTVVVAGVPDTVRGQRVAAGLFTGTAGPAKTMAQLLAACRKHAAGLPAHERPTQYFALSELPLTGSGKPSRALLQAWISERDARAQRIH